MITSGLMIRLRLQTSTATPNRSFHINYLITVHNDDYIH